MKKTVAVLGGGVGGLTAAHELIERGFEVHVYERESNLGGKAASQFDEGTGQAPRGPLPGEHGFRFFPSFYAHLPNTMARIPTDDGLNVGRRLKESEQMALADRSGLFVFDRHPPRDLAHFTKLLATLKDLYGNLGVSTWDLVRFVERMWTFATSCNDRRMAMYEPQTYWNFVRADRFGAPLQKYIQSSKFMVAMNARVGNAVTIGKKAVQLFADFFKNGVNHDAVLDGPTSDRWITPWRVYLTQKGVNFHMGKEITELVLGGEGLSEAKVGNESIKADYFVLAVPLDRAIALVSPEVAQAEPALARLQKLEGADSWMVGVQLYLRKRLDVCVGHIAYPDSDWALTSVSQAQFWGKPGDFESKYGDGTVRDVLSIDVSDWGEKSRNLGKPARACTEQELLDEVVAQIEAGLGNKFDPNDIVSRRLDSNIIFGNPMTNRAPLLIHPVGSWANRPDAKLANLKNLVLASDYVRTNTDLATMEGANEAARRAVNAILDRESDPSKRCEVFSMEEEAGPIIAAAKAKDQKRWDNRQPTLYEEIRAEQRPPELEFADSDLEAALPGMDEASVEAAEEELRRRALE